MEKQEKGATPAVSEVELLPCPFCGGAATRSEREFQYISCENHDCFVVVEATSLFGDKEAAIKAWNTRHTPDVAQAVEARVARIVAALEEFATHYPQSLGSGSTYALTAEITLNRAIAIARGEGET